MVCGKCLLEAICEMNRNFVFKEKSARTRRGVCCLLILEHTVYRLLGTFDENNFQSQFILNVSDVNPFQKVFCQTEAESCLQTFCIAKQLY